MALAVNSEMPLNAGVSASAATSLTYSFANTAGTFVLVAVALGSPSRSIASVTYGGAAMTLVKSQVGHDGVTGNLVAIYKLATPATGSNNVVISISGGSDVIMSGAISFTGENATPLGTPVGANGTNGTISVSITGTATGNIVVETTGCGSAMGTDTQTLSWAKEVNGGGFGNNARSSRADGNGGTVTLGHGNPGDDGWGSVAVEVFAAGGVVSVPSAIGWRNKQNPRLSGPIRQSRFQRTQLWSTAPAGSTVSGNGASSNSFVTVGQLSAVGNLTGKSAMTIQSAGSGSGTGAMSGASSVTINTKAAGSGNGAMSGASCVTINTRAAGSGKGALTGAASVTINTSGAGSGKAAMSGQSTFTISTGGTLTSSAIGSMIGRSVFGFAARVSGAGLANMTGNSGISESSAAAGSGKAAMTGRSTFSFAPQIFLQALTPISGRSQMNLVLRALMTGLTPPKPSWLELPLSNAYRANEISSTPRDNRIESEYRDNRITTEEAK